MKNKRNIGLDLLRIVSQYMICFFHLLFFGNVLNSATSAIMWYLEWAIMVVCSCGVDCYALSSGYFAEDKPTNYKRIIKLWFITLYHSVLLTFIFFALNKMFNLGISINVSDLFKSFLPVTNSNWYTKSYFLLFFLTPIINKGLYKLDEKESKIIFIFMILIFSVSTLFIDNWSQDGKSFIWLLIAYIFGFLVNKLRLFLNTKTTKLIILFIFLNILTWTFGVFFDMEAFRYNPSPTILFAAIVLITLFSRIKINSKYISYAASLTYDVFIFHTNDYLRSFFIMDKFEFINNYNLLICLFMLLLFSLIIFIVSLISGAIRKKVFDLLKIDNLCNFIYESLFNTINRIIK